MTPSFNNRGRKILEHRRAFLCWLAVGVAFSLPYSFVSSSEYVPSFLFSTDIYALHSQTLINFSATYSRTQIRRHCPPMELLHCPSISTYTPKLCFYNYPFLKRNDNGVHFDIIRRKWRSSVLMVANAAAADSGRRGAAKTAATAVVVEKPTTERCRFEVLAGKPLPFGATGRDGGVNFAIFSSNSTAATLCLITLSDLPEVGISPVKNVLLVFQFV